MRRTEWCNNSKERKHPLDSRSFSLEPFFFNLHDLNLWSSPQQQTSLIPGLNLNALGIFSSTLPVLSPAAGPRSTMPPVGPAGYNPFLVRMLCICIHLWKICTFSSTEDLKKFRSLAAGVLTSMHTLSARGLCWFIPVECGCLSRYLHSYHWNTMWLRRPPTVGLPLPA